MLLACLKVPEFLRGSTPRDLCALAEPIQVVRDTLQCIAGDLGIFLHNLSLSLRIFIFYSRCYIRGVT